MSAFKMMEELAKEPEYADAFMLEHPFEMFGPKADPELMKNMEKFFQLELTAETNVHDLVKYAKFHGWYPYAKRHPLLQNICKSEIVELQYSDVKSLPKWWTKEWPTTGIPQSMTNIYKAIGEEELTSGQFQPEKWKKIRDSLVSPMDKKLFSKTKVSSILDKFKEAGLLSNDFTVKFNERTKFKDGTYRATLSMKPTDFYRCSYTKAFASCLSPNGGYHYTVWGALTDASLLIFFWEPPVEITEERLRDTRLRTFLHLMADYGKDFLPFYKKVCQEAMETQNPDVIRKAFKGLKAKQWYLVVDKIHTDDHANNTHPVLFTLFDMLQGTNIRLAIPKDYTFAQLDCKVAANMDTEVTSAKVHTPINFVYGLGGYQDNLNLTAAGSKMPPNTEMLADKYIGNNEGSRGYTHLIRTYQKDIHVLDRKELINALKVTPRY